MHWDFKRAALQSSLDLVGTSSWLHPFLWVFFLPAFFPWLFCPAIVRMLLVYEFLYTCTYSVTHPWVTFSFSLLFCLSVCLFLFVSVSLSLSVFLCTHQPNRLDGHSFSNVGNGNLSLHFVLCSSKRPNSELDHLVGADRCVHTPMHTHADSQVTHLCLLPCKCMPEWQQSTKWWRVPVSVCMYGVAD